MSKIDKYQIEDNSKKYDENGYDKDGYDRKGRDRKGYDRQGYDCKGFNREGYNRETGTKFNKNGYDRQGYDKEGYSQKGYNRRGFDRDGYNRKTGTKFNENGYDVDGYNKRGFDEKGFNRETGERYDKEGYDKDGYDRQGYDRQGYNKKGFDINGINRQGIDKRGHNEEERENIKEQQRKNFLGLTKSAKELANGTMQMEEYIIKSNTSIDDLIKFAQKQKMDFYVIRGLCKKRAEYKRLKTPFNKKEYLESVIYIIDGKEVRPTEDDISICMEYMRKEKIYLCKSNIEETIRKYLRGELDLNTSLTEHEKKAKKLEKSVFENKELDEKIKEINKIRQKDSGDK